MRSVLKRVVKFLVYFHVFLALGLVLTHCSLTRQARKSYEQAKKEGPYDVVIVPGIPYDSVNENTVMKMRMLWAKHLYDSGFAKNIIFSGSAVYSPYTEGIIMKILADSLGIPSEHTFSEVKAEHSTENVYYSWKMAREMGFKKIAVATDPYQSGLLRSFARRHCPGVKSVPIVFGTMDIGNKVLPKIDPAAAFRGDFVSIMDREGFWKRFRGTMGKRIRDEKRADRAAAKAKEKAQKDAVGK
jgi:uncharacterized SAM-binding protein YcdF (DUF218 family)